MSRVCANEYRVSSIEYRRERAFRSLAVPYNDPMNDNDIERDEPVEGEVEASQKEPEKVELPPEFTAPRASSWDRDARPGKWTTIGCGIGIVLLIAALFAGSSLLRKTVWAGLAGTSQRIVTNLPGDLPPGERMRLTRNLDRFAAALEQQDEPYEAIGQFQKLARKVMEDRVISHDEVEELNVFLESNLPPSSADVPYSMP
jgi:hypothetical protein